MISVIIPVYNSAKTIKACLDSLMAQSVQAEIIAVDDGSQDDTVSLIKKFPRIKLLTQKHSGPAKARNLGANAAKGQVLVFGDSDMEFDCDFLKSLTKPITNGQAKGTWSGEEQVKNWNNLWARCWNYSQGRWTASMIGNTGQRRVFRAILKTEFDRVGGFDPIGYTDDWSLVTKLGYQPKPVATKFWHNNPESLVMVFQHARWIGKRRYKLGKLGTILTMIKANAAFSVLVGMYQSIKFLTPAMLIFKLVYDLGILIGAGENLCGGSSY